MVEADEALGGTAIQYREVQGNESDLFQSCFDKLTYLQGGAESGFTHVEATVDAPHLYMIKGTEKKMSLSQVKLSKSSLNQGDSFLLFANASQVWVWHGESANPDEKSRSNCLAQNMCTHGTVVTLFGNDEDEAFWNYLGDGEIGEAQEGDEDVEEFTPLLFRLSKDGPAEQVAKGEPVKARFGPVTAKFSKDALDPSSVFLLDAGWELFVWIGPDADRNDKISSLSLADAYCSEDPRTADLPLTMVKVGYEPSSFSSYFVE